MWFYGHDYVVYCALSPSCVLAVEGATGQWDVFMGLHGPPLGTLTVGSGVVLNANSVVAITGYTANLGC